MNFKKKNNYRYKKRVEYKAPSFEIIENKFEESIAVSTDFVSNTICCEEILG